MVLKSASKILKDIIVGLLEVDPDNSAHVGELWDLLEERPKVARISHKRMPSYAKHAQFIKDRPYLAWYLVRATYFDEGPRQTTVGSIYITSRHEVGLSIFQRYQRKGYGREAVRLLRERHPGPLLANINPRNEASIAFWKSLGFELRQVTYAAE